MRACICACVCMCAGMRCRNLCGPKWRRVSPVSRYQRAENSLSYLNSVHICIYMFRVGCLLVLLSDHCTDTYVYMMYVRITHGYIRIYDCTPSATTLFLCIYYMYMETEMNITESSHSRIHTNTCMHVSYTSCLPCQGILLRVYDLGSRVVSV